MVLAALLALALSEKHPALTWQKCTKSGCSSVSGFVVTDQEVRDTPTSDIDYAAQLGVTSSGGSLSQKLVTTYNGKKNIGSRLYLLASDETNYELFNFNGKELSYDVDLSAIPCGVNAALYTVEMPKAGTGVGAAYGTGYCDANYVGGTGCAEFDIQEANNKAMVFTSHPCQSLGTTTSNGQCQSDGCGFNAYRYGAKTFWGTDVNVNAKITVVTQFLTTGGSLSEVRRLYVQGGKKIPNPTLRIYNTADYDSISEGFCRTAGHQTDGWRGLAHMGESFAKGHVLVFSLWDSNDMGWLDGNTEYGPCGNPSKDSIEAANPDMTVTWSNIKFGDIDSTY
jgi:cellulose 1,4-beta-cellobiosidase